MQWHSYIQYTSQKRKYTLKEYNTFDLMKNQKRKKERNQKNKGAGCSYILYMVVLILIYINPHYELNSRKVSDNNLEAATILQLPAIGWKLKTERMPAYCYDLTPCRHDHGGYL